MKVLQLVDTLETGGAERMAINLANVLAKEVEESFLCATRREGLLKTNMAENVSYHFLNKKSTLDLRSIFDFRKIIKNHHIDIVHAHSTSFFLATIVKLFFPKVKIIWHDHYGKSEFLEKRNHKVLKICSRLFSHIFCVNRKLEAWARKNLKAKNISYLQNFVTPNIELKKSTKLEGIQGKRIIHLANLRPAKNHLILLEAFGEILKEFPDWSLHCVGKDFDDGYSQEVKNKIKFLNLEKSVFLYGSKPDVVNILDQSTIAVLPSKSEGLPLALIEYGMAGLPVIATNVGDCKEVIINDDYGMLISSMHVEKLRTSIKYYINNKSDAEKKGKTLKAYTEENFLEKAVVNSILRVYESVISV